MRLLRSQHLVTGVRREQAGRLPRFCVKHQNQAVVEGNLHLHAWQVVRIVPKRVFELRGDHVEAGHADDRDKREDGAHPRLHVPYADHQWCEHHVDVEQGKVQLGVGEWERPNHHLLRLVIVYQPSSKLLEHARQDRSGHAQQPALHALDDVDLDPAQYHLKLLPLRSIRSKNGQVLLVETLHVDQGKVVILHAADLLHGHGMQQ
mmetsp:Transcript_58381/g.156247  ORF Transcript_58381/g.156247 Transcript_58381/m.156247 type:complete len:205 (+) Transcript_58381:870-1484(+)